MKFNTELYQRALWFATQAHNKQTYPSGDGLPYIAHPVAVAAEVIGQWCALPNFDLDLAMCCALLHDVIEDTATPAQAIELQFGQAVVQGVQALSKNTDLPKAAQMNDSLQRILAQPAEIAVVKMADRICNLNAPPTYWTTEKRKNYQAEAKLILQKLGTQHTATAEKLALRIEAYSQYF